MDLYWKIKVVGQGDFIVHTKGISDVAQSELASIGAIIAWSGSSAGDKITLATICYSRQCDAVDVSFFNSIYRHSENCIVHY